LLASNYFFSQWQLFLYKFRFGALPKWAIDKLNTAAEQDLESWGEAVLTAPTMVAVFENVATH